MLNRKLILLFVIVAAFVLSFCANESESEAQEQSSSSSIEGGSFKSSVTFTCSDSESVVSAKGGPVISYDGKTVYAGYRQVSSNNQDPIVALFENGTQTWCKTDYDTSGDDSKAYGVYYDTNGLYVTFSATGGTTGLTSHTGSGWLSSYGAGGGSKVAVVLKLNPADGSSTAGSFIRARLSNGNTNSLSVTGMSHDGSNLAIGANSWYSPLKTDKSTFSCSGSSPFSYKLTLSSDLSAAVSASADGCS